MGEILRRAQELSAWVKNLEEFALSECLEGNNVPGWKLAPGIAEMQFINHEEDFKVLMNNGFEEAMLYERKPLTLAETEKLVGKAKFKELLNSRIHTSPGKPTLAPGEVKVLNEL